VEWMSDWIRQIILIIFLATFIDLLLPSSSLERYVKLVMGLIIIMAILQPILQLVLNNDRWNKFNSLFSSTMSSKTYATLDEIRVESEQISKVQQDEIKRKVQSSISSGISQQVSQKFHVKVVSAKVTAEFQQEQAPVVKQITVVATKETKDSTDEAIEPVQPVDINQDDVTSSSTKAPDTKLQTMIRQYIGDTWNLVYEQVEVQVYSP
jgi:stage III sporulation protein AF